MKRLKLQKSSASSERWMVSYADLITLLLAFFVVMYAISTVNEGKYRVLSDTLKEAFSHDEDDASRVLIKPQLGKIKQDINPIAMARHDQDESLAIDQIFDQELGEMYQSLNNMFVDTLSDEADWNVEKRDDGLAVELNSDIIFPSGSAATMKSFESVIKRIAVLVESRPFSLQVEGFTDNRAIRTSNFPSNWELSGARGASIVRLFESLGIESSRLSFAGYGEHHPVASNETEAGRAKNRRVVIVLRPLLTSDLLK